MYWTTTFYAAYNKTPMQNYAELCGTSQNYAELCSKDQTYAAKKNTAAKFCISNLKASGNCSK